MKQVKTRTQNKLRNLETTLAPYLEYWEEWIFDKACFLSQKEIISIVFFRERHTHTITAKSLGITPARVSYIYAKALRKLQNERFYGHYCEWTTDKILKDAKISLYKNQKEEFLDVPIYQHKLPSRLQGLLSILGNNINEILSEQTEESLLKVKGFGEKSLAEFKELLLKNDCLDLLRPQKIK